MNAGGIVKVQHPRKLAIANLIVLAAAVFAPLPVYAAPNWLARPGTIADALSQPDGSNVLLDAVEVDKIRAHQTPSYFVIREMWRQDSRIVVYTAPPDVLRRGQPIDVEGVMGTLPNGVRAILNPRIVGYLDSAGDLLLRPVLMKGLDGPNPWQWKTDLPSDGASSLDEAATPGEPSAEPLPGPTFCPTIASLLNAGGSASGDDAAVRLQCKRIVGFGIDPNYGRYILLAPIQFT